MIIHATVTITGDKPMLGACEARLRRLLSAQFLKNEVAEHHGGRALCYDLKVEGGIPFPVFAQASQEFPGLEFVAEWVNVAAGEKGAATIVNGRITAQTNDRIAVRAGGEHALYVEVAASGRLVLALTLLRVARDEWRGYALAAGRDALIRVLRAPDSDAAEVYATEGGPEWACAWRGTPRAPEREALVPPIAIDDAVFRELDQVARAFVADWIWFASAPHEEIAIERDRYARGGFEVAEANVRSARLHRLRAEAGDGKPPVHSTLGAEDEWVKDLVLATWARET
ncbi:MAG: hypothetical protein ACRET6_08715 [Burkholderiales bacterium]